MVLDEGDKMSSSAKKEGQKVRIDGEEALLYITDQSVMFERKNHCQLPGADPDHPERDAPPGPAAGLLEPGGFGPQGKFGVCDLTV